MFYDTPRRRRMLMPLAILLIGGGLAVWGTQRETKRTEEVRQRVFNLIRDVCGGNSLSAGPGSGAGAIAGAFANQRVVDELKRLCLRGAPEAIIIEVAPGDVADAGSFQGTATHVVTLRVQNDVGLGLRLRHSGDGKPIEILGYFTPAPR